MPAAPKLSRHRARLSPRDWAAHETEAPRPGAERRAGPRAPLNVAVSVHEGGRIQAGEALDLSAGGMRLRTLARVSSGTRVVLEFRPAPVGPAMFIEGAVTRVADGAIEFGVRFRELHPERHRDLARHVQRILAAAAEAPSDGVRIRRKPVRERVRSVRPVRADLKSTKRFLEEYATDLVRDRLKVPNAGALEIGTRVEVLMELPHALEPLRVAGRVSSYTDGLGRGAVIELLEGRGSGRSAIHQLARVLQSSGR